jgi:DNA-binding NarL/FixJ family response regulator
MDSSRLIIIHKNKALRRRIADFLTMAGLTIVNDTESLGGLQENAHKCKPHIILLDIGQMGDEFPTLLASLKETLPQIKFVFLGPEPRAYYAKHTVTMGADLYLSEEQRPDEWIGMLRAIVP